MDKVEGREVGSSNKNIHKERVRQGYEAKKKGLAKKKAVVERKNKNFSYTISDHKGKELKRGSYND